MAPIWLPHHSDHGNLVDGEPKVDHNQTEAEDEEKAGEDEEERSETHCRESLSDKSSLAQSQFSC